MNEDEHPNTDPSEEIAVVESPSIETQLLELNGDTGVLDISNFADNLRAHMVDDSENEVVLDSDDEEIQRKGVLTVMTGLSCDEPDRTMGHNSRETSNEYNKQLDLVNNHCNLGFLMRRGSAVTVSKSVAENCLAKSSLTDMGSNDVVCSDHIDPRYEQAALDFVGHYLSVNDVNLPQEVEIGNPNKLTSPPALSAKGSWNLARGANSRTKVLESRTFDWDDNQPELILGWKSHRTRSISMPQPASHLKFQEEKKVGKKCKDINLNLVGSSLIVHKSNQISEVRKATETDPLRHQLETNSSDWNVPDMDVGFDTQMAAEAIEALIYAPIPTHDATNDQGAKNMLENTSECAALKNLAMGCSVPNSGSFGSEVAARFYEQTKRSANKLNRNKSISFQNDSKNKLEVDLSVEVQKKVRRGKSLTGKCTRAVKPKSRASKTSSKVMVTQKEEEEFSEKENIRCTRILCSSNALSRHRPVESSMTEDTNCDYGGKRSRLDNDKLLGERKKRSKLGFNSSVEAKKCEASHKKERNPDIATSTSNLKSNPWIFPKRKRTCHYVPLLSEFSSKFNLSNVLDDENCNGNEGRQNKPEGELRTTSLSPIVKRKVRSGRTSWHSLEEMCVDNMISGKFIEESFESVGITRQMAHVNSAQVKASKNFSQLDNVDPILFVVGKENKESELSNVNVQVSTTAPTSGKDYKHQYKRKSPRSPHVKELTVQRVNVNSAEVKTSEKSSKLDKVNPILFDVGNENKESERSNIDVQASTTMPTSGKDYKQQHKRISARSPLLKELTRLGFTESLPDFVSKDSRRRRRNKSNICVLFSQSLDDRMIKKQKKILVRLGISGASDCSEATHFVTDRFVRTRNMLEAMALGKPVVTHLWLENCLEAKCFVDEKKYILQDFKKEKELGFSMLFSLAHAKEHPLLKDQKVIVTPNVKPSREMIEILVKKVHGQVVKGSLETDRKDKIISNDILILSCEEDYAVCIPFLEEGAAVYSSELLLNGIVIQKLEYERHQLFKDHVHKILQKKRRNQHVPSSTCA